jgi:hypothetical protein
MPFSHISFDCSWSSSHICLGPAAVLTGTRARTAAVASEKAWVRLNSFRSQLVVLKLQQFEVVEKVKVVVSHRGIVDHLRRGFGGRIGVQGHL